jgi:hypothetical protein
VKAYTHRLRGLIFNSYLLRWVRLNKVEKLDSWSKWQSTVLEGQIRGRM